MSLSGDFCSRVEQSQVVATLSNCAPSSKEIQSITGAEEAADAAIPGWGRTANGVEFILEVRDALMPGPCLEDGPTVRATLTRRLQRATLTEKVLGLVSLRESHWRGGGDPAGELQEVWQEEIQRLIY